MYGIRGFTIIEVMMVITIISTIVGVVIFNSQDAGKQSRDIERQSDLRNLQNAIELYKQRHGRYPAGCNSFPSWSGEIGTSYECPSGPGQSQYIRGHAVGINFAPDFIRTLPTDPKRRDDNSGYVYLTNAEGTVYKLMARRSVESEIVDEDHDFASCELGPTTAACEQTYYGGNYPGGDGANNKPSHCNKNNSTFQTTFAVWGGYPEEPVASGPQIQVEREKVICDVP